jgi:tetratricopeptide (TPR) repeat protein
VNRVACLILLALASPSAFADSAACLARLEADDAAGAVTACTAAIEADPEDARSWAIRGLAHLSAGRTEQGASDLDRALGIDAKLPMALIGRARVRAADDDVDGARADLQAVLSADKAHYDALLALGQLEWQEKHADEAQALFARAAKARPDVAYPWVASAVVVVDGDRRKAMKYLDKAIKASKTDASAFFLRGRLYFADEKWKDAAADLQTAAELAPENIEIPLYWARSLENLGRPAEALAVLDGSMQRHPNRDALMQRMDLRLKQGDAIGAEADYAQAKGANPSAFKSDVPAAHAIEDKYAPGLRKIEAQLQGELTLPSRECALDGRARWMSALQENRGDRALAEQSLGRTLREEYIACQDERLPPATEQFAQARQSIAALTGAVASQADALIRDCAAHPDMTQVCAERRDAHAQRAGKLLAGLRGLEEAASKRRQEVAAAKNGAGEVAANAVRQAHDAFTASASKEYGRYGDLGRLRTAIELMRTQPAPTISQRCTDPGVPPIRASDATVSAFNERSGRYFDCLRNLASELEGRRSLIGSAAAQLRNARTATDAVRNYRCSVRAGAGCVPDELWRSVDSLVTVAAVGQGESTAAAYARLLDSDIAAASRAHNDAIARRNEQLDDYEAQVQRQRMVDTFTETFGQATQGQGGYGNGGYRQDSSTSSPGMR